MLWFAHVTNVPAYNPVMRILQHGTLLTWANHNMVQYVNRLQQGAASAVHRGSTAMASPERQQESGNQVPGHGHQHDLLSL